MQLRIESFLVVIIHICQLLYASENTEFKSIFNTEIYNFIINESMESKISDSIFVDLNGDQLSDKLYGITCGNTGCTYYCFLSKSENKSVFIGTVFLHKKGFEVLKSMHYGLNDILNYTRSDVASGKLIRFEFDGKSYVEKSSFQGSSDLFRLLNPEFNNPIKDDISKPNRK